MVKKTKRQEWFQKFKELVKKHHRKNIDKIAKLLLKKIDRAMSSMKTRSKKYGVKCDVTLEELRELVYNSYGKPCKYDPSRKITYKNMVFDHIIPLSKGGASTIDNLQVISRFSNNLKGSLSENQLYKLMELLELLEPETRKDVKTRLAGGKR